MKKTLYIFFCLIGTLHFAQGAAANPFEESEKNSESKTSNQSNWESQNGDETAGDPGGGNPGPDLPIDDYIPLLVLTALGIIIYKTRKNRNLLS